MNEPKGKVRRVILEPQPEPEIVETVRELPKKRPAPAKSAEQVKKEDEALQRKIDALNREDYAGLSNTPRRRAREAALLIFYQKSMGTESWELAERVFEDIALSPECAYFAKELAHNAERDLQESNALITKHARGWTLDRLASVDRCILQLAISELSGDKGKNTAVVINEAVELSKKFGDSNSTSFINAILDSILSAEFSDKKEECPRED